MLQLCDKIYRLWKEVEDWRKGYGLIGVTVVCSIMAVYTSHLFQRVSQISRKKRQEETSKSICEVKPVRTEEHTLATKIPNLMPTPAKGKKISKWTGGIQKIVLRDLEFIQVNTYQDSGILEQARCQISVWVDCKRRNRGDNLRGYWQQVIAYS